MSGSKRFLLTISVILVFISIAYLSLEIPADKRPAAGSSYASEYLLGFSIPLVGAGAILLMGTHLVLRTKKKRRLKKSL